MEYECDKCGACCKHLINEVFAVDVLREPRLLDAQQGPRRISLKVLLEDRRRHLVLVERGHTCTFLGPDNLCQIYQSRPDGCVGVLPGEEPCQVARRMAGLPPLVPKRETGP